MSDSYLSAPQTALLATHCAACGKPLCDAVSVESGMGPECRKKYGWLAGDENNRPAANKLISAIAREISNVAATVSRLRELGEIGFGQCAEKLGARISRIALSESDGRLAVKTPYDPEVVSAIKGVPGRRWDPDRKVWTVPVEQKAALWAVLKRFFPGALGSGPKGPFLIPAE